MSGHADVIRAFVALFAKAYDREAGAVLAALKALEGERDEALMVREGEISAVQKVMEERRRAEAAEAALARAQAEASQLRPFAERMSRAIFRQRMDAPNDSPGLAARLDPLVSVARMRASLPSGGAAEETP